MANLFIFVKSLVFFFSVSTFFGIVKNSVLTKEEGRRLGKTILTHVENAHKRELLDTVLLGEILRAEINAEVESDTVILLEENQENGELTRELVPSLWDFGLQISTLNFDEKKFADFEFLLKEILKMSRKIIVFSFIDPRNFVSFLAKMKNSKLENTKVKWITLGDMNLFANNETLQIIREFQVGFLNPKSEAISYSVPVLYPVRKIRAETKFVWSNHRPRISNEVTMRSVPRLVDLKGASLQVAVVDNWPFFGLVSEGGRYFPAAGIDVSVLRTLAEVMNFTFEIVSPEDGQWGGPQADGQITGMIGMVARGEADLAIDEITITVSMPTGILFGWIQKNDSFFCIHPKRMPVGIETIVEITLSIRFWMILAICVVAYGLIQWVFYHYLFFDSTMEKQTVQLSSFMIKTLQSITVQGTVVNIKWWPLRFIFISWYLFGLLVHALYAGTLTAVLAAPSFEPPIETLEDLLNTDNILPVVTEGSSIHELFETASSGLYREIFQTFDDEMSLSSTVDEGVEKVLDGDFALIEARLASEIRASIRNKQLFYLSRQSFYPQAYGIACKRGSPLTKAFSTQLARLVEGGLIDKWKRDEVRKLTYSGNSKQKNDEVKEVGPKALNLNHLQGAFFLFFIGISLATITGIFERVINRKKRIV